MTLRGVNLEGAKALGEWARANIAVLGLGRGGPWVTGVPVRFRGRHFVVSASHGVELIRETKDVLVAAGRRGFGGGGGVLGTAFFRGSESYDVGVVELVPEFALTLDVQWIAEKQMDSSGAVPGRDVFIVGFPEARAIRGEGGVPMLLNPIGLFTSVAEGPPPADIRGDLVDGLDLLAPIPDKDTGVGSPTDMTDPRGLKGISGGPVFLLPTVRESGVWSPSDAPLAGIQVAIFPRYRLMKFQRIEFALECLRHFDERKPLR